MISKEIIEKFELKETDLINGYFEDGSDNKGYMINNDTILFCHENKEGFVDIYRTIDNYRTRATVPITFLEQVSKSELMSFINNRLIKPSITPQ